MIGTGIEQHSRRRWRRAADPDPDLHFRSGYSNRGLSEHSDLARHRAHGLVALLAVGPDPESEGNPADHSFAMSAGSILGATLGGLAVAYAPVQFPKLLLACVLIAAAGKTVIRAD